MWKADRVACTCWAKLRSCWVKPRHTSESVRSDTARSMHASTFLSSCVSPFAFHAPLTHVMTPPRWVPVCLLINLVQGSAFRHQGSGVQGWVQGLKF